MAEEPTAGSEQPVPSRADRPLFSVAVSSSGITTIAGRLILALLAAHIAVMSVEVLTGSDYVYGIVPLFDLDREQNVPTLASTLLILGNALLCGLHWRVDRRQGNPERMWLVLAMVLAFLALDEFASIHETLMSILRKNVRATGVFYFVWVIPYLALSAAVGLACIPFLRRQSPKTRSGLLGAGILYVFGAAGIEMIAGPIYESLPDKQGPLWILLTTCEELLELCAMALCLRTLVAALLEQHGPLVLSLQPTTAGPDSARQARV